MFKLLTQIKAKSIKNFDFLKFIICVRGGHCDYSPLETKILPTSVASTAEPVRSCHTHSTQWVEIRVTSEQFVNSSLFCFSVLQHFDERHLCRDNTLLWTSTSRYLHSVCIDHVKAVDLTLKSRGCTMGHNMYYCSHVAYNHLHFQQ
jgi:hypothetical protein